LNNDHSPMFGKNLEFSIEGDKWERREWAYHNNRIFKKIKKLMDKYDRHFNNIMKVKEKFEKEAEDFVENKFDKIIILENLGE